MSIDLPQPIAAYLAGANAFDAEAAVSAFTADAVVRDEGQDFRGGAAILHWKQDVIGKYHAIIEPLAFDAASGVLTGRVSGNFPGSPVVLRYAFTLVGGRIAALAVAS